MRREPQGALEINQFHNNRKGAEMEEKKIITTDAELHAVIAIAASMYADEHKEINSEFIMKTAAEIGIRTVEHLTREERMDERIIKEAKKYAKAFNFAKRMVAEIVIAHETQRSGD